MPTFVKKRLEVEAFQWQPGVTNAAVYDPEGRPYVITIHGQEAYLDPGDWVITEPDGLHHYPCKPDIFAATYDPQVHPVGAWIDGFAEMFAGLPAEEQRHILNDLYQVVIFSGARLDNLGMMMAASDLVRCVRTIYRSHGVDLIELT